MASAARHGAPDESTMTDLVFYLVVFLAVGVFFLFIHLLIGKFIRPYRPDAEKMTIYECGEPTVGSAWIQFDLRYYVVALLFVIFDVEVAFFFPWAVVFGKANELSQPVAEERRADLTKELAPAALNLAYLEVEPPPAPPKKGPVGAGKKGAGKKGDGQAKPLAPPTLKKKDMPALVQDVEEGAPPTSRQPPKDVRPIDPETARTWAWIAFGDILVFFGVLMVGFAYLWRRGDIDWVRSTAAEQTEPPITV
jgi:NADH-quinone oxidoreductase subunit A